MQLNTEIKQAIKDIIAMKNTLQTGVKDGERVQVNGYILAQCIEQKERDVGRMIIEEWERLTKLYGATGYDG